MYHIGELIMNRLNVDHENMYIVVRQVSVTPWPQAIYEHFEYKFNIFPILMNIKYDFDHFSPLHSIEIQSIFIPDNT